MGQRSRKVVTRHRLLAYQRISQRLRTAPLLTAVLGVMLLGLSFLGQTITLEGVDTSMLDTLAAGQPVIVILIFASVFLYIFAVFLGRNSYVEARPKMLRIQTGLLAVNISYRRIRQIRLSQVGTQLASIKLSGGDRSLAEPLMALPCSLLDFKTWPWPGYGGLKRLWSRLMFSGDSHAMMVIVRDAMVFNQQVDGRIAALQQRTKQEQSRYMDPIERAARAQRKS